MLPLSRSKTYHHGDLRTALLETTVELINEAGVAKLSLREVSRRAGVSHAAAYNHFADKGALVQAAVDEAFGQFAQALNAAGAAGRDAVDSLLRIGIAYVRFANDHRAQFKMMFRPELTGVDDAAENAAALASYGVLVDAVERAKADGAIAGASEDLLRVSWSTVHGLAALIVDGPGVSPATDGRDLERMVGRTLNVLLDGMRPRRS